MQSCKWLFQLLKLHNSLLKSWLFTRTIFFYTHKFCRSGIRIGNSEDSLGGRREDSKAGADPMSGSWDYLKASSLTHLVLSWDDSEDQGCWPKCLSGLPMYLNFAIAWRLRVSGHPTWKWSSRQGRKGMAYYNVAREVTYCLFHCTLLVETVKTLPRFKSGRIRFHILMGRGEVILKKSTMIGENFGNCNLTQLLYFYITEIKLSAPLKIFFF